MEEDISSYRHFCLLSHGGDIYGGSARWGGDAKGSAESLDPCQDILLRAPTKLVLWWNVQGLFIDNDCDGESFCQACHSCITKTLHFTKSINYDTGVAAMADRRSQVDNGRNKRQKTTTEDSNNPYLAHMYDGGDNQGYENGNGNGNAYTTLSSGSSDGLTHFKRHATTSAQAAKAEDGPNNPFNGKPLSEKYFRILKTRRNLPVQSQRSENTSNHISKNENRQAANTSFAEPSSSSCFKRHKSSSSSVRLVPVKLLRFHNLSSTMTSRINMERW